LQRNLHNNNNLEVTEMSALVTYYEGSLTCKVSVNRMYY
jgi:hypothetical protein